MKKISIYMSRVALLIGLCACGACSSQTVKKEFPVIASQKDGLLTVDLMNVSGNTELKLSDIVSSIEIVQLEGDSSYMMFERGQFQVSKNYILIGREPKLFERKTGKFITNVGAKGNGPGEYLMIYDSKISEEDNRIFILPWNAKKILTYDLKGKYIGDIPLAYGVSKGKIHPNISQNEITVMTLPFKSESIKIHPIWVQDTLGNIKHSIDNNSHFVDLKPDFSNEITSGVSGDEYIYSLINAANLPDTLYHYNAKTNTISPTVNMYIRELKPTNGDYSKTIWNMICELPSMYVFNVSGTVKVGDGMYQGQGGVTFMLYKDDLTGGGCTIVNDFLAGEKVQAYTLSSGSENHISILDPDYFEVAIENAEDDETKERLIKLSENINPNGNDIIVIGKYR